MFRSRADDEYSKKRSLFVVVVQLWKGELRDSLRILGERRDEIENKSGILSDNQRCINVDVLQEDCKCNTTVVLVRVPRRECFSDRINVPQGCAVSFEFYMGPHMFLYLLATVGVCNVVRGGSWVALVISSVVVLSVIFLVLCVKFFDVGLRAILVTAERILSYEARDRRFCSRVFVSDALSPLIQCAFSSARAIRLTSVIVFAC
ncbi:hypothetical protein Tco_1326700 [Tanacetum coccineum]